jgi:hypothetical protein
MSRHNRTDDGDGESITDYDRIEAGEFTEYRGIEVYVDDHMADGNITRWTDHVDRFLDALPEGVGAERLEAHTGRHYIGARLRYRLSGLNVGVTLSQIEGFRPIRVRSTDEKGAVFVLFDPNGEIEQ